MHHKTSFQLVDFFKAKNDCLSDNISVSLLDRIPVLFLPKERLFLQENMRILGAEKREVRSYCPMGTKFLFLKIEAFLL